MRRTSTLEPLEPLEPRRLFAGQLPLPTMLGQEFVVNSFDNDVISSQLSRNDFGGNSGQLISTALSLSAESNSGVGNSLRLTKGAGTLGGYFTYVAGPNSVTTTTNPAVQPAAVAVPGQWLDSLDIYEGFGGLENRSIEQFRFDVKHTLAAPLVLKVELKDSANRIANVTRSIAATGAGWTTVSLNMPGDFSVPVGFDWRQLQQIVFVVEDSLNAPNWTFLLDNLRLADTNGSYPDFPAMTAGDGTLLPQYADGFLDHVLRLTSLFFVDSAGKFTNSGGIIQDTANSLDTLTIGGVGFQLNSYIINSQNGYESRAESATRTVNILRKLWNAPQGVGGSGIIGYEGWFYHFLGVDGLRKQNFGGSNVELSPIDTALAIAGVVASGQYFTGSDAIETEIRTLSEQIYGRVNWRFMVNDAPGSEQNQFFLAWKPETNDGGYQFDHPTRPGRFTGSPTNPLTVDYYTDEGLLIALLAMGSPNPANRLGREVWDAIFRSQNAGSNFVQSFPGALFTYQFASAWLDTDRLGTDNHPTKPIDFYQNTKNAIAATRNYAMTNSTNRDTWFSGNGATRWGLSAAAGPFGGYSAEAARPAALNINQNNPLEVGLVTPYAVGSAIVHEPALAIASLWRMARQEDLNQDGKADLLHPRFGYVDSFTLDIADATPRGGSGGNIRPPTGTPSGPWANIVGYAIDNGPMLSIIDNYLSGQFIPNLLLSHPQLRIAMNQLFNSLQPKALSADFPFEQAAHRVNVRFSENVSTSLSTSDLVLTNLTTVTTITPADYFIAYNGATNTAAFTYNANGGIFPDGNYRATFAATNITDAQGNPLEEDFELDFFVFTGDANRDRSVNINDFAVLASRFNLPGTFSQGDFNYNGTTEIGDFAILASKFNTTLAPPAFARGSFLERAATSYAERNDEIWNEFDAAKLIDLRDGSQT